MTSRFLAQRNEALTREILTEDGLVEGRDFALEVYTAPQALLERLRQEPDACQLVLLDVQIQEMNGLDVGRALLQYGGGLPPGLYYGLSRLCVRQL